MKKTRVIVAGADNNTGLGTARALESQDVHIVGMCWDPAHDCCTSRAWDEIVQVEKGLDSYLEMLINLGETYEEKSILISSDDSLVLLISENREKLKRYYEFVLPEQSVVDLLMDKTAFHVWAQERNFPVPESHVATSKVELDEILAGIQFPVVLKPLFRTSMWNLLSPDNKIHRLNGKEDIEKVGFDLFTAAPKFLVQRWIPGSDADVHFCLFYFGRDGREIGHYTGRKLLQWFVGTGNTAICVGTQNDEVHRIASEIFHAASFRGLGSVEFKQSAEDGEYYVTEPTVGRNNLQSYVAVSGGVNLTRAAFYDALGRNPLPALPKGSGSVFIAEYNTIHALLYLFRRKNLRLKALLDEMRRGEKMSFAYFKWRDPLPFLHLIINMITNLLKRIMGLKKR